LNFLKENKIPVWIAEQITLSLRIQHDHVIQIGDLIVARVLGEDIAEFVLALQTTM
jgi:hypothetical protein